MKLTPISHRFSQLLARSVSALCLVAIGCGPGSAPATGTTATSTPQPTAAGSVSAPAQPVVTAPVAGSPVLTPSAAGAKAPVTAGTSANGAAGANGGAAGATGSAAQGGALPCSVAPIFAKKCASCHGATPIGGAPMSLIKQSDFSAQLKSVRTSPGNTLEVAKLVKQRINDAAMPMPPGALLPQAERDALNAWLDKGHPGPGEEGIAGCEQPGTTAATPSTPTTSGKMTRTKPDGSKCYELHNHGQQQSGDTSPFPVAPGEMYVSFFFNAPWTEPSELVSFSTLYDNRKVLHHWLLYTTLGSDLDGTFAPGIGTHLGDSAQLLAGWAVGGNDVEMPADVGLRLPPPGSGVMIEWHFYNTSPAPENDASGVEICVLPAGTRKHTAGMTWLGTENFNGPIGMPPKTESQYGGTCYPSRTGMNGTEPIHIFELWPHMHTYGRHMRSVVNRADGRTEEVFTKPFDFNYQITYDASIDLFPGDTITSTCTFNNTSNSNVAFGPSTTQEMCYQFAFSYPAGALDNGVPSLVGATNTCW